jgi:4-aminobutyrate aminotransferase-like enzyme
LNRLPPLTPNLEFPRVRTPLPGPRSAELLKRFDARYVGSHDHADVPFVMASERGWIIEDVDGNTFADHVAAWGSTPLRGTDRVMEAVIEAERRIGMQNTAYTISEPVVQLLDRLIEIAPAGIDRVAYSLSGTLAVEGGIKLAREATGRPMILAFLGQYHGESTYLTAGTSTDLAEVTTQHAHFVPGLVFIPYPNAYRSPFRRGAGPFDDTATLDYLEDWVLVHQVEPEQIAGVLIEPVLGEGGIVVPSQRFWDRLHAMCSKWGWKLILDEVQTCMGRCGTMFAAERYGIRPDLVLLGKGFSGGGQPIGAILGTEEVMRSSTLQLGGTFAWTPPSVVGALESIEAIIETGALDNVMELERIALETLSELVEHVEQVGDVRASGAYTGVEFVQDKGSIRPAPAFHRAVHQAALRRGVLGLTQWGKWVYRLEPPLDMPPELFRWSCEQIVDAVIEVAKDPPPETELLVDRGSPP